MQRGEETLETVNKLKFTYVKKNIKKTNLGMYDAQIYKGRFNEKRLRKLSGNKRIEESTEIQVAIKSYTKDVKEEIKYERARENLEYLSQPGNRHPNLIRYFGHQVDNTENIIYLVTEFCVCSVAELLAFRTSTIKDASSSENLINLSKKDILRQSVEAVNFLHNLGLIHRNLHPDNFLVALDAANNNTCLIKLTDFQYAKDWVERTNLSLDKYKWSDWITLPEFGSETLKNKIDSKGDVFILGCYFYFVLTDGKHPFECEDKEIKTHILEENSPVYKEDWKGGDAWNEVSKEDKGNKLPLIRSMIRHHPADRKSAWKVLQFLQESEESYDIYGEDNANKLPGLCIIIAQENFHDPANDILPGNDCAQLWRTFTRFGFEVIIYKNLKGDQMLNFLHQAELESKAKNKLEMYKSLVVCILSHGTKGMVYGVDDTAVPIEGLRYKLGRCEALKGKLKMFIILACQGDNNQLVYKENIIKDNYTSSDFKMTMPAGTSQEDESMTDFLILISTIENFYTYYTEGVGSLFIESLCGSLLSEYNDESIKKLEDEKVKEDVVSLFHSSILPRVAQGVFWVEDQKTKNLEVAKQTPELRSTLKRSIRFRAIVQTSKIAKDSNLKDTLDPVFDGQNNPDFKSKRAKNEKLWEEYEKKKTP